MTNGEFKYCLELLIVYINCIKINFSDTNDVSVVQKMKIQIFKFNFSKLDLIVDGEKYFIDYGYSANNKPILNEKINFKWLLLDMC